MNRNSKVPANHAEDARRASARPVEECSSKVQLDPIRFSCPVGFLRLLRDCTMTAWERPGDVVVVSLLYPGVPLLVISGMSRVLAHNHPFATVIATVFCLLISGLFMSLASLRSLKLIESRNRVIAQDKIEPLDMKALVLLAVSLHVAAGLTAVSFWFYAHIRPPVGPICSGILVYVTLAWVAVGSYVMPVAALASVHRIDMQAETVFRICSSCIKVASRLVLISPMATLGTILAITISAAITVASIALVPVLFGGIAGLLCSANAYNQLLKVGLARPREREI